MAGRLEAAPTVLQGSYTVTSASGAALRHGTARFTLRRENHPESFEVLLHGQPNGFADLALFANHKLEVDNGLDYFTGKYFRIADDPEDLEIVFEYADDEGDHEAVLFGYPGQHGVFHFVYTDKVSQHGKLVHTVHAQFVQPASHAR